MTRLERALALGVGLCYGFVALHFVILGGASGGTDYDSLYRSFLAVGAVLALGVVTPLTARIASPARGALAWSRNVAVLGFALTAVEGTAAPQFRGFVGRGVSTPFTLDPYMWLLLGGIGAWLLCLNLAALGRKPWHAGLSVVGCGAAVCALLFPVALYASVNRLASPEWELPLAAGLGLLMPAWFIGVALNPASD